MKTLITTCAVLILTGPALAKDNSGRLMMNFDIVKGQKQVRGHFGSAWTEAEVKDQAAQECKAANATMVAFQLGKVHKRKGTAFTAVCE